MYNSRLIISSLIGLVLVTTISCQRDVEIPRASASTASPTPATSAPPSPPPLAATGSDNQTDTKQPTATVVQPPARIVRFDLSPANIKAGEKIHMCYQVADAASASITNLSYSVKLGPAECIDFAPSRSTTFTLEARNADGKSVTREARVMVEQLPIEIAVFKAEPSEIEKGKNTVIQYKVVNAKTAQIRYPGGAYPLKNSEGSVPFKPAADVNLDLIAQDPEGKTVSKSIPVKVVPPAHAVFLIKPVDLAINLGADARLCYGVTWGSTVSIYSNMFHTRKDLTSSENTCVNFRPTVTDTYTLTATSTDGVAAEAKATVTVILPPPRVVFYVQAATQRGFLRDSQIRILRGEAAQLCYGFANVQSFTINPKVGDTQLSANKCVNLGELEKTTDYTLSLTGIDKSTQTYHARVNVYPPPEILSFDRKVINGRYALCFEYRNFSRAEISPAIVDLRLYQGGLRCVALPPQPSPQYTLTVYGYGKVPLARATFPRAPTK